MNNKYFDSVFTQQFCLIYLLIRRKKILPGSLYPPLYDWPPLLSGVLINHVHNVGIPCFADLSADVKAGIAVEANNHHDFLKEDDMTQHEPVLIV